MRKSSFYNLLINKQIKMSANVESIPDGFWSLFPMLDGIWRVPLWRKILSWYFNLYYISLGVA